MYSREQLRILAQAYLALTGKRDTQLGRLICGNHKFVTGLLAGRDISAKNAELASEWFLDHWPLGAAWPRVVPRVCIIKVKAPA
jgi:hypothetical protein